MNALKKIREGHPSRNQTDHLADDCHHLAFSMMVAFVGSGSLGGLPGDGVKRRSASFSTRCIGAGMSGGGGRLGLVLLATSHDGGEGEKRNKTLC